MSGPVSCEVSNAMYKVRLTLLPTEEHVCSLNFNSCKIVLNFESTPDQLVLILFYWSFLLLLYHEQIECVFLNYTL